MATAVCIDVVWKRDLQGSSPILRTRTRTQHDLPKLRALTHLLSHLSCCFINKFFFLNWRQKSRLQHLLWICNSLGDRP